MVVSRNSISLSDNEIFETANGLWKGKKPPYVQAGVIRNTNFTEGGRIDFTDVAVLAVEKKQMKTRTLQPGDIIVERSGGGPKQPVGRVVYFEETDGDWSFSNFTSRVRVRDRKSFDPRFVFYFLLHFYHSGATDSMQRRTAGIRNLDWKAYKESVSVPLWPLSEQRRIASVLLLVQLAIEQQEWMIALTTELKKALMRKLFAEGTRGEPQKQTEIGPLPESWVITTVGELCHVLNGYAFKSEDYVKTGGILNFRVVNMNWDGTLDTESDCRYLPTSFADSYSKYLLREGDILFVMVGATRGKLAQIPADVLPALMNQNLWRIVPRKGGIVNSYLYYFLRKVVEGLLIESEGQARGFFKKSEFKAMKMPVPSTAEQEEVAFILGAVDQSIAHQRTKKRALIELFHNLLHQLMTAQIRVNDIDLGALGIDNDDRGRTGAA